LLREARLLRPGPGLLCEARLLRPGPGLLQTRLLCPGPGLLCEARLLRPGSGLLREGLRLREVLRLRASLLPPDSSLQHRLLCAGLL
jgi:hypothetical protein